MLIFLFRDSRGQNGALNSTSHRQAMNNNVDINNKLVGSKILKTFWAASWSASHRGTIFDKVRSVLSQPFSYVACLQRSADGHVWADSRTGWTITTLHWDLRLFALSFIYFYCFFYFIHFC